MAETIEYRVQVFWPGDAWVTLDTGDTLEPAQMQLENYRVASPHLKFRILRVREEVLRYETVMTDDA